MALDITEFASQVPTISYNDFQFYFWQKTPFWMKINTIFYIIKQETCSEHPENLKLTDTSFRVVLEKRIWMYQPLDLKNIFIFLFTRVIVSIKRLLK